MFEWGKMSKLAAVPLYRQVANEVMEAVESGEWGENECLPSEIELGRRLGVSQGTVRKALDLLVAEGVLYRRQGVGTFVGASNDYLRRCRFVSLAGADAGVISVELLGCVRIHVGEQLAEMLGLRRGDALWQVRRLLRVDGDIVGIEETLLPEAFFPDLDVRRLREMKDGLRELCWRDFGVRLIDGVERFRAIPAGAVEARMLQIEVNEPLLQVMRLAHDFEGAPMLWSALWLKTEKFSFESPVCPA